MSPTAISVTLISGTGVGVDEGAGVGVSVGICVGEVEEEAESEGVGETIFDTDAEEVDGMDIAVDVEPEES